MKPSEHEEGFIALSVAVAWNVVDVLSLTVTGMLKLPEPSAVPVPAAGGVQLASLYTLIVDPASAVPFKVGLLLFAGEVGVLETIVGAAGGFESSTYVKPVEQGEVVGVASVAVA